MIYESTFSGQTDANATRYSNEAPATSVLAQDRERHRVVRIVATLALAVATTYLLIQT